MVAARGSDGPQGVSLPPLPPAVEKTVDELARRLGIEAPDRRLLAQALTHSSYSHEYGPSRFPSNERLEFLGDAVVNLCAAHLIWEAFPDAPEGVLTRLRAGLVNESTLARRARELGLDQMVLLGAGEERSGGRRRPAMLADLFEAVAGALYVSEGWGAAKRFLRNEFRRELAQRAKSGGDATASHWTDAKSRFQEYAQARGEPVPVYRVVGESGPPHKRLFTVEVEWRGEVLGRGQGGSRKRAEQRAAEAALRRLRVDDGPSVGAQDGD